MRCRSKDSRPIDHLHRSGQCIGKGRMPERALQFFDEMQLLGLQPRVFTYSAVIRASRDARVSLQLFVEI